MGATVSEQGRHSSNALRVFLVLTDLSYPVAGLFLTLLAARRTVSRSIAPLRVSVSNFEACQYSGLAEANGAATYAVRNDIIQSTVEILACH